MCVCVCVATPVTGSDVVHPIRCLVGNASSTWAVDATVYANTGLLWDLFTSVQLLIHTGR